MVRPCRRPLSSPRSSLVQRSSSTCQRRRTLQSLASKRLKMSRFSLAVPMIAARWRMHCAIQRASADGPRRCTGRPRYFAKKGGLRAHKPPSRRTAEKASAPPTTPSRADRAVLASPVPLRDGLDTLVECGGTLAVNAHRACSSPPIGVGAAGAALSLGTRTELFVLHTKMLHCRKNGQRSAAGVFAWQR